METPQQGGTLRYSTSNTNLAACIGSLKIPIKSEDPVTVVNDQETGNRITTFWFEDQGAEEFCGAVHNPRQIERYWNNRRAFEAANVAHPLVFMRAALDKRDWLTKAWHGRIMPAASLARAEFTTQDITLASVLMGIGYRLLRLDKPDYVFGKIPQRVLEDFRNFEMIGHIERPACLMRRALEARKLLVALTRDPRLEEKLQFTDGTVDRESGRVAHISAKASDREIEKTLHELYRP